MGTVKAADKDSLPETIFITGILECYLYFHLSVTSLFFIWKIMSYCLRVFLKYFANRFFPCSVQVIFILKKSSGWHWLAPDWRWEVLGGACERQTLCEALPSLPLDVWHHCSLGSRGPAGQRGRSVPERRLRHRALSYRNAWEKTYRWCFAEWAVDDARPLGS